MFYPARDCHFATQRSMTNGLVWTPSSPRCGAIGPSDVHPQPQRLMGLDLRFPTKHRDTNGASEEHIRRYATRVLQVRWSREEWTGFCTTGLECDFLRPWGVDRVGENMRCDSHLKRDGVDDACLFVVPRAHRFCCDWEIHESPWRYAYATGGRRRRLM